MQDHNSAIEVIENTKAMKRNFIPKDLGMLYFINVYNMDMERILILK